MALEPSIRVCLNSSCDTLTLYETTGVYDETTNLTGYGAPNILTSDVTIVTLRVTNPSGDIYDITLTDNDFPKTNEDDGYEIDMSEIGDITNVEDGYWTFKYTVFTSGDSYTVTQGYMFYCNSECCVAKMLAKVDPEECDCDAENNTKISNYIRSITLLDSLKNAAYCFNEDRFDKIKTLLAKLCRNINCKTCN